METINSEVQKAIEMLNSGGIIIYPTDTAFGIGCRIDDHQAVDRLFAMRKRPKTQPSPVLVNSIDMALAYFNHPSDIVRHLMTMYWPGALTIVAPCKRELVYSPIRAGGSTIGLRRPNHRVPQEMISAVGVPILGPSANFHGKLTPYLYQDLDRELIKLVDFVLEGECPVGSVSTVVDCSVDPYKIIRQGAVRLE